MKMTNEALINASPQRIFTLASQTSAWPQILGHYRFVRTLAANGEEITLEMGARRGCIPIRWTAKQQNLPNVPEIRFTHIRGWTTGMAVVWRFEPRGAQTRVIIEHQLRFRFPFAADWIGEHIVGNFFIDYVATKTLAGMKKLAEAKDRL